MVNLENIRGVKIYKENDKAENLYFIKEG